MLRTQIYLPEDQVRLVKRIAFRQNISVSEAIRRLIKKGMNKGKKVESKRNNCGKWLIELAREAKHMNFKGPQDLASNLDRYLYDK